MKQGIGLLSIIPLRRDPSEQSEMVSQLLFGEAYEITEETSAWYKILTQFDQYAGWIDKKMFSPVSGEYYEKLELGGYTVSAPWPGSQRLTIPCFTLQPAARWKRNRKTGSLTLTTFHSG